MEDEIYKSLTECKELTSRIDDTVGMLNELLNQAATQNMYILINKEEIDVGGKILQNKFTLRRASYTVTFRCDNDDQQ